MVFSSPIRTCYRQRLKALAFTLFNSAVIHFGLPFDGVSILACSQLILHDVMPFLLLDVFLYRWFIESYRTHIITFWPKIFCCRICTSSLRDYQNHQGTFALQISHWTRHADLCGILTSMWTWSGIRWPPIISIPLGLHTSRKISRTLSRSCEILFSF